MAIEYQHATQAKMRNAVLFFHFSNILFKMVILVKVYKTYGVAC